MESHALVIREHDYQSADHPITYLGVTLAFGGVPMDDFRRFPSTEDPGVEESRIEDPSCDPLSPGVSNGGGPGCALMALPLGISSTSKPCASPPLILPSAFKNNSWAPYSVRQFGGRANTFWTLLA